jgi:hypothetical protein
VGKMKKTCLILLGLLLITLLNFTLFGDELYTLGKPIVTVRHAHTNNEYVFIPMDALHTDDMGDYIYVLNSEPGYSRTIHTVIRIAVEVVALQIVDDMLALNHVDLGTYRVVVHATGALVDGKRVVLG